MGRVERCVCRAYKLRELVISILTKCPSKLMLYKQEETGDWQREERNCDVNLGTKSSLRGDPVPTSRLAFFSICSELFLLTTASKWLRKNAGVIYLE